ncbi:MAG: lactate/malate dehydrogenase family protein [Deltaproteobacteria bacterium]|nr:MAG: lactate/malate dehydrogenase family protein [Deltaproteobacteria bacterium]
MRVAIIGGGGRVGVCAAYALQWGGIVSEIILFDILEDLVRGEALDLLHGSAFLHDQRICSGDLESVAGADIIIITAGLRRKPDESRLDLVNRNVSLFLSIIADLKAASLRKDAILLVVSNPVDILTYLAVQESGLPPEQIVGLGTLLDTSRFCSLIADAIKAAPTQVKASILGEHGDSMVPVWSSATCNGFSLENHPELTPTTKNKIFERTRQSGAEVIRLKGGAGWAVGTSIATLVHAIVLDQRKMLPVSSLQTGTYGLAGICISVPTLVGLGGILEHVELELWPRELQGLKSSANALQETIKRIGV